MAFSAKYEDIGPELAEKYLALTKGNRRLRENYILSLAVDMTAGKWVAEASEIVFDTDGALIDGHHRLNAVKLAGTTVRMLVKHGVPKAARNVIDTGHPRPISDQMTMFRPGVIYPSHRRANLIVCTKLYAEGAFPVIRTLEAYDTWMRHFRDGIDWVVEASSAGGIAGVVRDKFRVATIAGAFAFAHKTSPSKVEKFFDRVASGENLVRADPALTLHHFVVSKRHKNEGGRSTATLKTLNAILAELEGRSYKTLQSGELGLEFFRKAYRGSNAMAKLAEPWEGLESAKVIELKKTGSK